MYEMADLYLMGYFQELENIFHSFFFPVSSLLLFCSFCYLNSIPLVGIPPYGLNTSVGESKSSSGQLARSPTLARLNPSASSPNFFKYLRHNSSGEQSGHFAQKR